MKISTVTLLLACLLLSCVQSDFKIVSNPAYAIGTVNFYRPTGGSLTSSIHFDFSVTGISHSIYYVNGDNRWNVPGECSNCSHGNKFMVQYDSLDPGTARMLFSYQLKDSTDYKKYVALFKKSPPGYPSP